ncbi:MAG: NfeD family protein [Terrimicrobiaceae bacterium]|nr:NfeD family protein [Terrimicrobiaceae bacterium]
MSAPQIILVLTVLGFLMLAAEVFVPGMVLGIFGLLTLAAAVVLAYAEFGVAGGSLVFAGIAVATMAGFIAWMFAFPRPPIGRRIMLERRLEGGQGEKSREEESLLGARGEALTPLRPVGTARIHGKKVDVVAESGLIPAGAEVVVVGQEGLRIVVRKTGP